MLITNIMFSIGQKVWTGIYVCNQWQRMASGIIVAIHDDIYEVDVMSLHGGAPWIRYEDRYHLEIYE